MMSSKENNNNYNKKEDDFIKDIKEFIKFDDIQSPYKDILPLEINKYDYDPIWQRILKLIIGSAKEEKEK